jgi:hypothetical protein
MLCTVTRDSAWGNFSPFGRKIPEGPMVLIINYKAVISTELTYLSSMERPSEPISTFIVVSTVRPIVRHFLPH